MLRIGVVTLFPELFTVLHYGVTGRALKQELLVLNTFNPRDFSDDKQERVDDRPYGGGPGMVMQVAPLRVALQAAKHNLGLDTRVIHLSPQGQRLQQADLVALAQQERFILLAGRYEGIDERFLQSAIDVEYSIGDYILSGGELAAAVIIDGVARLLPGALGHEDSAQQDSFMNGLLDYPHYTRPEQLTEGNVPAVLLSGDHEAIARWRLQQSLGRTWLRRPDLLAERQLTPLEQALLDEFIRNL